MAFTVVNKPSLRQLVTRPLTVLERIPKFGPFTNMFREITGGSVKEEILAILFVDALLNFVVNVRFRDQRNIGIQVLIKSVLEHMVSIRDEIIVVMILGGIIKSVETRVSI